jgi:hypothetical protein
MERIDIPVGDLTLTFKVTIERDDDIPAPWDYSDGHGPVSDWTSRDKRPGEVILNQDRGSKLYYDWAEATRIAKRDGWGVSPTDIKAFELKYGVAPTRNQIVQMAVQKNFDYLKGWVDDEWHYHWVKVTLLDEEGDETDIDDSLGGIDDEEIAREEAMSMAKGIAEAKGVSWDVVTVQTYRKLEQA